VGLGQRQLSTGFLTPALCELNRRVSQRQLRMVDCNSSREGSQQRGDRALLPVERQAEQVVCEQPRGVCPVGSREQVPHGLDDLAVVHEPACGPTMEVRNLVGLDMD
jgi:hypothetical protein